MSNLYRAQILLEPEQHKELTELAEQEGQSISELVRAAVREYLKEHSEERRRQRALEALQDLASIRQEVLERFGPIEDTFLEEAREERVQELEATWRDLA